MSLFLENILLYTHFIIYTKGVLDEHKDNLDDQDIIVLAVTLCATVYFYIIQKFFLSITRIKM